MGAAASIVEGERLALCELTPGDVGDRYVAWLNDPEVNRYLESRFVTHTPDGVRKYVAAMAADPANLLMGIFLLDGGAHIGNIKIGSIDARHATADLGLLIGEKETWGQGYATEAIELATRHTFSGLGLRKLVAGCYEQNLASIRAFEKAGWQREGLLRSQFVSDGRRVGQVLLGVLAGG